jgi:hypothetical protein
MKVLNNTAEHFLKIANQKPENTRSYFFRP